MAHKKKIEQKAESSPYTVKDAMIVADDIFKMSKDKNYKVGAFVHGLIFAFEYAQHSYKIPQQQIASIRRDCRKYLKEIDNFKEKKE
jgi:hypothetical protein